jgi:hypothetical protein
MNRRREKQYQSKPARIEESEESGESEEGKGELLALIDRTNCVVSSKQEPAEMIWSEGSEDWVMQQQETGSCRVFANCLWLQRTSAMVRWLENETREVSVMWRWTSEGRGELATRTAREEEM